ncbi:hypothetical protein NVP2275O_179 [Vibrio phage 2.275.O._10N.286.54.E11]|nr:hypothetical protein NVP2275O_179 [Vibrio phage 2.275.O._10N.286.54.E11]
MGTLERIRHLEGKIQHEIAIDEFMWFMPPGEESHCTREARDRLIEYLNGQTGGHHGEYGINNE